jgi:protein-S-isoprenylcysteine O-methyltransferase Ste14
MYRDQDHPLVSQGPYASINQPMYKVVTLPYLEAYSSFYSDHVDPWGDDV